MGGREAAIIQLPVGARPIGVLTPTTPPRATAEATAAAVRTDTQRAGYFELDQAHAELLAELADAQVRAALPPPLDPDSYRSDRWALEAVETLSNSVREARDELRSAEAVVDDARDAQSSLERPSTWAGRSARNGTIWVFILCSAVFVGALMMGPIAINFLAGYFVDELGWSEEDCGALAFAAGAGLTFVVLAAHALTVASQRGVSTVADKVFFVVIELGVAVFLTVIRLKKGSSMEAWAGGAFEAVPILVTSWAIAKNGRACERDWKLRLPWKVAERRVALASQAVERARANATELEARLDRQVAVIEEREGLERVGERLVKLAMTTGLVEHVTTVAEAQTAASRNSAAAHAELMKAAKDSVERDADRLRKQAKED